MQITFLIKIEELEGVIPICSIYIKSTYRVRSKSNDIILLKAGVKRELSVNVVGGVSFEEQLSPLLLKPLKSSQLWNSDAWVWVSSQPTMQQTVEQSYAIKFSMKLVDRAVDMLNQVSGV